MEKNNFEFVSNINHVEVVFDAETGLACSLKLTVESGVTDFTDYLKNALKTNDLLGKQVKITVEQM